MFNKPRKEAPAAPVKAARRGGSFSVIGADVVIKGDLVTAENLQVNGRIEGDIQCGVLHQGGSGTIVGNIVAEEARLAGLVDGTVSAGLLILEPSARVTGDVSYETLSIESGARVEGRFAHRDAVMSATRAGPRAQASHLAELFPPEETAEAAE
ncbi:MAG TPA: polymer-forming cytoskeletal protein [Allosphingosinicella sp.]|uniref:bactofilin family protein n=1 Tax=Allosphingosinicella sp. TaxID=2823234 RepID=UPI002ED8526B